MCSALAEPLALSMLYAEHGARELQLGGKIQGKQVQAREQACLLARVCACKRGTRAIAKYIKLRL